jgi:dTDP-glucose pyrophosphorylase
MKKNNLTAIILAGGKGTRLGKLTKKSQNLFLKLTTKIFRLFN